MRIELKDPCVNCGEPVNADDRFCASCGEGPIKSTPNCAMCGESIVLGDRFCAVCGHDVQLTGSGLEPVAQRTSPSTVATESHKMPSSPETAFTPVHSNQVCQLDTSALPEWHTRAATIIGCLGLLLNASLWKPIARPFIGLETITLLSFAIMAATPFLLSRVEKISGRLIIVYGFSLVAVCGFTLGYHEALTEEVIIVYANPLEYVFGTYLLPIFVFLLIAWSISTIVLLTKSKQIKIAISACLIIGIVTGICARTFLL